jgi:hypothetical protein
MNVKLMHTDILGIFADWMLVEVSYSVNIHVEKGILEEASLTSWIDPVSEM